MISRRMVQWSSDEGGNIVHIGMFVTNGELTHWFASFRMRNLNSNSRRGLFFNVLTKSIHCH